MELLMKNAKTKTAKPANVKTAGKPAIKAKPVKAVAPVAATVTTGNAKTVAAANVAVAATKYAELNKAFLSKYNKRPIFGEKRPSPVDYAKHNPANPTERDYAFIHAIRTVYADKSFTSADIRCDTGNIARAVKLNMLQSLGTVDGVETFKAVSNKA
jgi:hypothetical protein